MAIVALPVLGAAIGWTAGGTVMAAQIGWVAGSLLATMLTPTQTIKQEGPKLTDLSTQTAEWGSPIPRVFGTYKLAGNVIWAMPLQETKHVEESGEGKGGGGTQTETTWYSYAGSWAVAFCEGESAGIKNIWFDSVLVYDGLNFSGGLSPNNVTMYNGSDVQEINWYIQSNEPDTPAYRHVAYVVFNSIALENYGNRIPSVSVEMVMVGADGLLFDKTHQDPKFMGLYGAFGIEPYYRFSPEIRLNHYQDNTDLASTYAQSSTMAEYDEKYFANMFQVSGSSSPVLSQSKNLRTDTATDTTSGDITFWSTIGTKVYYNDKSKDPCVIVGQGLPYGFVGATPDWDNIIYYIPLHKDGSFDESNIRYATTYSVTEGVDLLPNGYWEPSNVSSNHHHWSYYDGYFYRFGSTALDFFIYRAKGKQFIKPPTGSSFNASTFEPYSKNNFINLIGITALYNFNIPNINNGDQIIPITFDIAHDKIWILVWNDTYYNANPPHAMFLLVFNLSCSNLLYSVNLPYYNRHHMVETSITLFAENTLNIFSIPISGDANYRNMVIDINTYEIIREIGAFRDCTDATNCINFTTPNMRYSNDKLRHYTPYASDTSGLYYIFTIYLKALVSLPVPVSDILTALLIRAGLSINDFDVSAGIDLVDGYIVTKPMSTRAAIAQILTVYQFDLVETEGIISLKKRTGIPTYTITDSDIVDSVIYKIAQDVEFSKQVNIQYANKEKKYEPGVQTTIRQKTNSAKVSNYQFNVALPDNKAKQISEIIMYNEWVEKTTVEFTLPIYFIHINPATVISLTYKGDTRIVRITNIELTTDKTLILKGAIDNIDTYYSEAVGTNTNNSEVIVTQVPIISPSYIEPLDIPMLDNAYNLPGIYLAASGYGQSWPGCAVWKSVNIENSYTFNNATNKSAHTGRVASALASGPTHLIDKENTVDIILNSGSLYDITEENLLNANNYILIGSEVLQYQEYVDNLDGTHTLSNLLRGRRGTEWAIATHSVGELFVILSNSLLFDSTASLNVETYYKAVTTSTFVEDAVSKHIVPKLVSSMPLSPWYVRSERNSSNDLLVKWMRRSRSVSGYFKTLQLFEESEMYEIDILDSSNNILVTKSGIIEETYIYTNTDQLLDNPAHITGDPVNVIVYQISDTVQRGYGTKEIL